MSKVLLTINAGSSSIKFSLFEIENGLKMLDVGQVSGIGTKPKLKINDETKELPAGSLHKEAFEVIVNWLDEHESGADIVAAGHRVVHGGLEFTEHMIVNATVIAKLRELTPLAPLHQPHNLAAIDILSSLKPNMPQIACFDTAFHSHHDPLFNLYAIPKTLRDKGIRHYGFHGLSYEWVTHVLQDEYPKLAKGKVIAAHLGSGASICAIKNGIGVDTTMGMTIFEGLPMGTRSGSIDPGAILYMLRNLGMSADEVERILRDESGLKGLSGISNDVKTLTESKDPNARMAIDYFVLKVAQFVGSLAVSLGGVDTLVFTGGIGENSQLIREAVLKRVEFLNIKQSIVIPANEEKIIAMHTRRLLQQADLL